MKIWLDDIRPAPFPPRDGKTEYPWDVEAPYDKQCFTGEEAVLEIMQDCVSFISFDHDLGPDVGNKFKTGYDVAKRIEKWAYIGFLKNPIRYKVHSANPVGAENIKRAMESAWKYWNKKEGK